MPSFFMCGSASHEGKHETSPEQARCLSASIIKVVSLCYDVEFVAEFMYFYFHELCFYAFSDTRIIIMSDYCVLMTENVDT